MSAGTTIGRYELLRLIAAGGMGEVYLARQQSTVEGFSSLSAVKLLIKSLSSNQAFVRMFLDEARIVGRLHHKNIVQVRDVAQHEGQYYMVMEYIPGQNLRELLGDASIPDRPLFPPRLGAEIFADIASALACAHAEHLVHRDVSPNNILISDEGVPKLIDFGVARALSSASLTNPGTLKGKFGYMAPEYVRSQAYDHRIDLFSLGVVMWETFARRRLFRGVSAAEQLHQLLEAEIKPLDEVIPGFPRELAAVIGSALEREPSQRIPSAIVLAEALGELSRSLPPGPDLTLGKWLESRIPGRIEDRRQIDMMLAALPPGSPIPEFSQPFPDAGSVPGTYGFHPQHRSSGFITVQGGLTSGSGPGSAGSGRFGEQAPPAPAPAPAPAAVASRSRWGILLFGFLAGVAAIAIVFALKNSGNRAPATTASGSAPIVSDDRGAMSLVEAHRQIGLRAMADGDLAKAHSEFAEGLRLGGGGDLLQLLEMTTPTDAGAATPVAVAAPPTVAVTTPADAAPKQETRPAPARPDPKLRGRPPAAPRPARTTPAVTSSPPTATSAPAVPTPPPTPTTLTVTSIVPNARVFVDDVLVGQTPLKVPVAADVDHDLVIKARSGELLLTRRVTIPRGTDRLVLVDTPIPTTPKTTAAASAEPPTPPTPAVAVKAKPTPRVTADGSVSAGAGVVRACSGCHAKAGVGAVSSRHYTRAQWERFFASGQHDRYVGIGDQMSAGQLMAARAFLRANAADSAEHQGAGVQELP